MLQSNDRGRDRGRQARRAKLQYEPIRARASLEERWDNRLETTAGMGNVAIQRQGEG